MVAMAGIGMGAGAWIDREAAESPQARLESRCRASVQRLLGAVGDGPDAGTQNARVEAPGSVPAVRRPFPQLPHGAAQVEQLTEEGATLLPVDGSRAVMVYRWQLPADVKEGDVLVDGRVDERATEQLRQWIRDTLAEIEAHGHPIPLTPPTLTGR